MRVRAVEITCGAGSALAVASPPAAPSAAPSAAPWAAPPAGSDVAGAAVRGSCERASKAREHTPAPHAHSARHHGRHHGRHRLRALSTLSILDTLSSLEACLVLLVPASLQAPAPHPDGDGQEPAPHPDGDGQEDQQDSELDGLRSEPTWLLTEAVLLILVCIGVMVLSLLPRVPHPQHDPIVVRFVVGLLIWATTLKAASFLWVFYPAMTSVYPVFGVSMVQWCDCMSMNWRDGPKTRPRSTAAAAASRLRWRWRRLGPRRSCAGGVGCGWS